MHNYFFNIWVTHLSHLHDNHERHVIHDTDPNQKIMFDTINQDDIDNTYFEKDNAQDGISSDPQTIKNRRHFI